MNVEYLLVTFKDNRTVLADGTPVGVTNHVLMLPPGGYDITLDGGGTGEIDGETFSADLAVVTISGINVHPGIARGRMVNAVRLALDERTARLKAADPLAERLRRASTEVDAFRKKIVATKEGGAVTGEERLREFLADLYGNVIGYEGRPSQTQVQRADALARELAEVVKAFDSWVTKELPAVNSDITKERLEPVKLLTREEWEKRAGRE